MAPHIIRAWSVYKGIKKLHVHFITLVHTHIYTVQIHALLKHDSQKHHTLVSPLKVCNIQL